MRIQKYTSRKRWKTRLNEINHVQLEKKKTSTSTASWATLADSNSTKANPLMSPVCLNLGMLKDHWQKKKLTHYPPLVTETEFLLRILIQYHADNWQDKRNLEWNCWLNSKIIMTPDVIVNFPLQLLHISLQIS